PFLSDVESLRKGFIKTTKGHQEFTVLLVGETGTGKTAFLSFLSNVLSGNGLGHYVDKENKGNEAGGGQRQSQTNAALLYEFPSQNNVLIRILDTPGFADTRGLTQDELHTQSIAETIRDSITNVHAILILTNGTVARFGATTDYVLATLMSMFPRTLVNNIGILFTNVASSLKVNFEYDSIPKVIPRDSLNLFYVDNPLALLKHYQDRRREKRPRKEMQKMRKDVEDAEEAALDMLVDFFDWLDSVKPQPTNDIVSLYYQTQEIETKIENILSRRKTISQEQRRLVDIRTKISRAKNVYCHSNCHIECGLDFTNDSRKLIGCSAMNGQTCKECGHSYLSHSHFSVLWQEEVYGTETFTDEETKRQFDNATTNADRKRVMRETVERKLAGIQEDISNATEGVSALVEGYASLSLSGSFTSHIHTTIKLLNVNLETLRHNASPPTTIEQMEQSIAALHDKLAVLEAAA
ncbi:hypothetical protein PHLGIDRAFT_57496, partial [Phlebiopsis gigantea 11061_1 CR5-6]